VRIADCASYLEPGRLGSLALKNRLISMAISESMAGLRGDRPAVPVRQPDLGGDGGPNVNLQQTFRAADSKSARRSTLTIHT
jgi:hypothetical protein